jgi:hypothetical protein
MSARLIHDAEGLNTAVWPVRGSWTPGKMGLVAMEAVVDLPRGRHTLLVRVSDTAGALQPSNVTATWNVKGYNNNAWHRVTIDLEQDEGLAPLAGLAILKSGASCASADCWNAKECSPITLGDSIERYPLRYGTTAAG